MDKTTLTPEESLLLISSTIEETKRRFEEGGHMFIFWGILMFIVTLSQYTMIRFEMYSTGYPALLYPLGWIYSYMSFRKKKKQNDLPSTIIGNILTTMGAVMGANLMILGFFFSQELGQILTPLFLIIFASWIILCGMAIRFKSLIIGGAALNIIAFTAFFIREQYHPLIMSVGAVIALIIPGILLNINRRKDHV